MKLSKGDEKKTSAASVFYVENNKRKNMSEADIQ